MTIEHEQSHYPESDTSIDKDTETGRLQSTQFELHGMRPNGLPKREIGDRLQNFLKVKTSVKRSFATKQIDTQ